MKLSSFRSTDTGTVVIHAALVVSFAVLLATGLRIATDDPQAAWLIVLDPILPSHALWYWHLLAGAGLTALVAAYIVYTKSARLRPRTRLDRARLIALLDGGARTWAAIGVLVFWVLMTALLVEIVTGLLLFAGAGRGLLWLHLYATFVCLLCVAGHVLVHTVHGGLGQVLRVFRPTPLVLAPEPPDLAEVLADYLSRQRTTSEQGKSGARPPAVRLQAHPLATGIVIAASVFALAIGAEQATRPELDIVAIETAGVPKLDGDLSEPVWTKAPPVSVLTSAGGDFGGTHQSTVEIRAVHDGVYAYFAFVWDDPTRSLKHMPLLKRDGRWYVAATREDLSDEQKYNEDKFSVLLARSGLPLIGGAIHLATAPVDGKPSGSTGLGLHYTLDGSIADVWVWRASHSAASGYVANCHFGGPNPLVTKRAAASAPYTGGYALDPGNVGNRSNIEVHAIDGRKAYRPARLPRSVDATEAALGRIDDSESISASETARWWMSESETVLYSPEHDAGIPDGTIIPSILSPPAVKEMPDSIRGQARWAAGRWTLELRRRLYTNSPFDVPVKSGTMLWVAAFDHADKRHTRHLRPFILEVE